MTSLEWIRQQSSKAPELYGADVEIGHLSKPVLANDTDRRKHIHEQDQNND